MSDLNITYEDFVGFSYNGVHSSSLGIFRTSTSNRYDISMINKKHITTQVPGQIGTYYFGSVYEKRNFVLPFAFDGLTENQISLLKQTFNIKTVGGLIFDEEPYKIYMVKPSNTIILKTLCFEEKEKRIYKGTGEIAFISYSPYAKSKYEFLDDYELEGCPNVNQWAEASRLPSYQNAIDETIQGTGSIEFYESDNIITGYIETSSGNNTSGSINQDYVSSRAGNIFPIQNIGDSEIPFLFCVNFNKLPKPSDDFQFMELSLGTAENMSLYGNLKIMIPSSFWNQDKKIIIDSKNYSIYIHDQIGNKQLANSLIQSGQFFNIPQGASIFKSDLVGTLEYHYLFL